MYYISTNRNRGESICKTMTIKRYKPLRKGKPPRRKKRIKKRRTVTDASRLNPYSLYWRDRSDDIWRLIITEDANGRCCKCGKKPIKPNAHHLITRERPATRCLLENGMCLCPSCHTMNAGAPHNITDSWRFSEWIQKPRTLAVDEGSRARLRPTMLEGPL